MRYVRRCSGLFAGACAALVPVAVSVAQTPDITHSNIQDAVRYPSTGASINGKYGYAWGSYTCNLGAGSLSWVNGGSPALAMNAYRLHDGRLMQIGLGFCKHACCVSNGTGCAPVCSTTGFGLKPGCRDIYSASFNGGTARLGPRSGINPYTGSFATIASGTGDAIWRHVQVAVTDMDATAFAGARYFAEGVYVCMEELPADKLNNATYRPMLVANTGTSPTYNWTVTGESAMGKPAIWAWREHGLGLNQPDTSVQVVNADVPGEGRFVAAGKATSLGGGLWRYDYAVFNVNSHRSGGGFRVPIRSDAVVTNIGFNAPPYHSGEIYDNTPWTVGYSAGNVGFAAPAKFEVSPNTSALRWGTMYNFWFTANVAPAAQTGSVSLELFRPGTPTSISIAGLPVPEPVVPCAADFDNSGHLGVADIFSFLGSWYALEPRSDFNHDTEVTVEDIFDYLEVWFVGCS